MNYFAKFVVICAIIGTAAAGATSSISLSSPIALEEQSTNGVVTNITRCGGNGTPIQLRVSECEGRCSLVPGRVYNIEYDFIPSSAAPGLSLACDLVFLGTPHRLFDTALPNSGVLPGQMYTVRFSVVPNDILSGRTVNLRAIIYHTDNRLLEICVESEVDILPLPF